MKKLLLLALLFAAPQAFALFKTTGETAQQIEQEDDNGGILNITKPQLDKFLDKAGEFFGIQPAIDKIKSSDYGDKLLTLVSTIQDLTKSSFQTVEPVIEKIKQQSGSITLADLQGLINQLKGYAAGRLTGIPLKPALGDIFNKVKDTYKKLYESDNELYSIQKGNIYSTIVRKEQTKLADAFLQALIFNIVQGKASDELLPLITHSLELKSKALTLQPAKGNQTAGDEDGDVMSIPTGEIAE